MPLPFLEKSTVLQKWLAPELLGIFSAFLEERKLHWTPDASGKFFSGKIYVDAMEHLVRNHDSYRARLIEIEDLDMNNCFNAMQRAGKKRGGRVSSFDEKTMKTVVMLFRFTKIPVDDHLKLLASISKRSTNRSRPAIKRKALELRAAILAYCHQDEVTKGCRSFQENRDKAILAILLTCSPLRVNTLSLLKKEYCDGSLISLPADTMKGREAISFTLMPIAALALRRYLNLCSESSEWLFTDAKQNRMTRNGIYKSLRRRCESLTNQSLGTHDFRRIIATAVGQHVGQEFAAATLVVSLSVLKNHYDLSDSSQKLDAAIRRINEELK